MSELENKKRSASETRETRETKITASIDLDGTGEYQIKTGDPMFDHLVEQLSRHSLININLIAEGDNITDLSDKNISEVIPFIPPNVQFSSPQTKSPSQCVLLSQSPSPS